MTMYSRDAAVHLLFVVRRTAETVKVESAHLEELAETIIALHDRLAEPPRVIRTREGLAALDPDTLLEDTDGSTYVAQDAQKNPGDLDLYADDLPAVVIATGDEYRAARQALKEAGE